MASNFCITASENTHYMKKMPFSTWFQFECTPLNKCSMLYLIGRSAHSLLSGSQYGFYKGRVTAPVTSSQ